MGSYNIPDVVEYTKISNQAVANVIDMDIP